MKKTEHQNVLKIVKRSPNDGQATDEVLTLPQDLRQRGRLKALTDSGVQVGLFLERGQPLKHGELLLTECGKRITVNAAHEEVATATAENWLTFSRVCYHLGNRHVPLQIGDCWLRFKSDHVLEAMVENFGLSIHHEQAPFEPESGAYANAASADHGHHHHDHHHH